MEPVLPTLVAPWIGAPEVPLADAAPPAPVADETAASAPVELVPLLVEISGRPSGALLEHASMAKSAPAPSQLMCPECTAAVHVAARSDPGMGEVLFGEFFGGDCLRGAEKRPSVIRRPDAHDALDFFFAWLQFRCNRYSARATGRLATHGGQAMRSR